MGTSSGRRWRMVALGAVAALAAGVPSVAGASPPGCVPGAAGVGDAYFPTYGNGGYDVGHYDLDIAYDPASDRLDGEATIRARATKSLCSFNLDLVGLEVESVTVNGRPAAWDRSGQELTVTPERRLSRGQRFQVAVVYGGVPVAFTLPGFGIPTGFMATDDGAIVAGQPEAATAWFPVNDHPIDKASYTFDVSVPEGYEVVANGLPRRAGRGEPRPGWTTSRWEAREPMASYLATIDIGQWDERRWRTDDGLPVIDAVDPAITGAVRREVDDSLSRQDEILDMLSAAFGPYPFSTAGAIVDSHEPFLFALETQTRSVYSWTFWEDNAGNPVDADWVVVHELAHQWFGDDVALARWQDIWLNEGFASYAEWLWEEHEGRATPAETLRATHAAIPADDPFWSVTIGDPGPEQLFHDAVYTRGAMTLQALREEVGDQAFWRIIRTWAASNRGGHGTTPEFIALAERIAGQQLDALFDTWLFTPSKPALPATSEAAASAAVQSSGAAAAAAPEAGAGADAGWWARFQQREHHPH